MKWLVVTLMLLRLRCVIRDPEHDIFRPISMYQTVEYAYLGTAYLALVTIASILLLRKLFRRLLWLMALDFLERKTYPNRGDVGVGVKIATAVIFIASVSACVTLYLRISHVISGRTPAR